MRDTVRNRSGEVVDVSNVEVAVRLDALCTEEERKELNVDRIARMTMARLTDGITTWELDDIAAGLCADLQSEHYLYDSLASKIMVSNMARSLKRRLLAAGLPMSFSGKTTFLSRRLSGLLSNEYAAFVGSNAAALDEMVQYDRDTRHSYFALCTMEKSYLMRVAFDDRDVRIGSSECVESPQDMWMRVAITINIPADVSVSGGDIIRMDVPDVLARIKECYDGMSMGLFTHATPTLFNAGTVRNLASCYLLGTEDSLVGIYKTISDCAQISKFAGGIGVHVSNVRGTGSKIKSTNGTSDGLIPMLKVFNETARYCNQAGRRKGSIAVYLEVWHVDVEKFVELRRNTGAETERCRDLFPALWVCDEFMKRALSGGKWYLMSPDQCPGLVDAVGEEFSELYERYVREGKYMKGPIDAMDLLQHVMRNMMETGTPYILYKDHVNRKCNQQNVGTVRSSNLCVAPETEVLTLEGTHMIRSLVDREVHVWNGKAFAPATVRRTGVYRPLLRVEFSNGEALDCTPEHGFWVEGVAGAQKVPAHALVPGAMIQGYEFPVVPDSDRVMEAFKYPYTHGLFSAMGGYARASRAPMMKDNVPVVELDPTRVSLMDQVNFVSHTVEKGHVRGLLPMDLPAWGHVPVNGCMDTRLRWLEGLFDGGGFVRPETGGCLEVQSPDLALLRRVKRLVNTLGVDLDVRCPDLGYMAGFGVDMDSVHTLTIRNGGVARLVALGFAPKLFTFAPTDGMALGVAGGGSVNVSPGDVLAPGVGCAITVKSVMDSGRRDDTYCFTEPLENRGVFNGILTSQCAEITEISDSETTAVCNLASIAVNRFYDPETKVYDHAGLHRVAELVTRNLNNIIDINGYPTPEAKRSNMSLRPIGVGVQGFGDLYCLMRVAYESPEAIKVDAEVMETIYHGALTASVALAAVGRPYSRFEGSPFSRGVLQFDMWAEEGVHLSGRYDWDAMRARVIESGTRNSLLTALMPTASTSQILGNSEGFEPIDKNLFKRTTLAGQFKVVNTHLMRDLMALGLWTPRVRQQLMARDGSVQGVTGLPAWVLSVYKTVWEVPQKAVIDHAAARGPFVDQSMSMNLYMASPDPDRLLKALVYGWQKGLKTGCYYLRSAPAVEAIRFGNLQEADLVQKGDREAAAAACARDDPEGCVMCSA